MIMENMSKRQMTILVIGAAIFAFLLWSNLTSVNPEIRENCKEFVVENGCYLNESQISDLESGQNLKKLIDGTAYPSVKAACGCVSGYNVTPSLDS